MHRLVAGRTGMGKSTLMREHLLPAWRRQGYSVAILDPLAQQWGPAKLKDSHLWMTTDPYEFLAALKAARRMVFVVDEPDLSIKTDAKTERAMQWAGTVSRNYGHLGYFLCQSAYQLPPRFRACCTWGYIFNQVEPDARCLSQLFGEDLMAATTLPDGTFLHVKPLQKPVRTTIFKPRHLPQIAGSKRTR